MIAALARRKYGAVDRFESTEEWSGCRGGCTERIKRSLSHYPDEIPKLLCETKDAARVAKTVLQAVKAPPKITIYVVANIVDESVEQGQIICHISMVFV
ncbi:hypothetical protein GWI33_000472 [Rhynchophorus ferrugineus]|uniref:Uncharacterized protein n=1 Tax=Rhynchophorus ferrugineus TaxID=354439 RepID=A0A834HT58_RHYFE|nr:hypothetical protein GWI33_000472 [Rhynchophorus ferrugineus]